MLKKRQSSDLRSSSQKSLQTFDLDDYIFKNQTVGERSTCRLSEDNNLSLEKSGGLRHQPRNGSPRGGSVVGSASRVKTVINDFQLNDIVSAITTKL